MKLLITPVAIFFLCSMLISSGCHKGNDGGGGGGGTTEADLVVTTNPVTGSVQAPALGPNFDLSVSVTSTMPSNGVKIEVTAKKDDGTNPPAFFTQTINTSSTVSNFSITNSPVASQCLVEIKVTSLTKATNVWTGSYRYSRK